MHARQVDPRDQRWEVDDPVYRVTFWRGSNGSGWVSDDWELTGADIDEVLAWADERADDGQMTVWLVHDSRDGLGLVRLAGIEPTAEASVWPPWARERMARRPPV